MFVRNFYVYILTNTKHTILYVGFTNDIHRRVHEHKNKTNKGFTQKYNVSKLVYYEEFDHAYDGITREKQLKAGSRKKKVDLINSTNKEWKDLSMHWLD